MVIDDHRDGAARCPGCGDTVMVLSDARLIRHYCEACRLGWTSPSAHPSYDDRQVDRKVDVSRNLLSGDG